MNIYETPKLLGEYLLFHYGKDEEVLPWSFGPKDALGFAVRTVTELLDRDIVPANARALESTIRAVSASLQQAWVAMISPVAG